MRGRSRLAFAVLALAIAVTPDASEAGAGAAAGLRTWISLRFPGVEWVATERLAEWMAADPATGPVLLDVRTPEEFEVSRLHGARRADPVHPYDGVWGRLLNEDRRADR